MPLQVEYLAVGPGTPHAGLVTRQLAGIALAITVTTVMPKGPSLEGTGLMGGWVTAPVRWASGSARMIVPSVYILYVCVHIQIYIYPFLCIYIHMRRRGPRSIANPDESFKVTMSLPSPWDK